MMFKRFFLFIAISFSSAVIALGQDNIAEGDRQFKAGNYDEAISLYNKQYLLTGDTANVNPKIRLCTKCKNLIGQALTAASTGNYDEAIDFYSMLSQINPLDPRVIPGIENATRMKAEAKTYKIGDTINGYRICFVDETGQHGLAVAAETDIDIYFHTAVNGQLPDGARVPSINELELIAPNASKVGLYNDRYWSSSTAEYDVNGSTKNGRYYLSLTDGARHVGKRTDLARLMWILSF